MNRKILSVVSAALVIAIPARAQHGGGGHGGGFGGGHAMGGHAIGSSIGHSVGHWFGGRSGAHGSSRERGAGQVPPLAGAAMVHGHIVQLPGPGARGVRPIMPRRPLTVFGFRPRSSFLFGFADLGFCSPFESFLTGYGFGNDWGCGQGDYFFDPFSGSGYSPDFTGVQPSDEDRQAADLGPDMAGPAEFQPDVIVEGERTAPVDKAPHHRRSPHEPDAMLQLRDGTMYGLRDYWTAGDRLYYVTNYGGQNSVPLSQIDFGKTQQLNADRGEKFAISQPAPN